MTATYKIDETQRLQALRRLDIMDTAPEPEFDELVEVAAAICEVPISLVSLLDERRQWFKAAVGLEVKETDRELAFCAHTITQTGLFVVEDATADIRFATNPLVTGTMNIRFYAGVPLSSPDGQPLGSLCVIDTVPRNLTHTQMSALRVLGRQANSRLELREQRKKLESALAEIQSAQAQKATSESRFTQFMDSGPFLSFLKDRNGRFLFYNRQMAEQFGVSQEAFVGKRDVDIWPGLGETYRANDRAVLDSGTLQVADEEAVAPDGARSLWRSYKFPCIDSDGATLIGGISIEVTQAVEREAELRQYQAELEAANSLLRELATTDPLTGLANRRTFDERVALEFTQARRHGRALSIVMLDVDNFKKRNDLYGHDGGDATLVQLARLLEECVREGDLVVRYGGEEFVILLPETDEPQAVQMCERLLNSVRLEPFAHEPVTLSAGIAALHASTPDPKRLVTLADEALYAAKRAGKDRVIGYGTYYQQVLAEMQKAASEAREREIGS